jgi:hypothetical protein
LGRDWSSGTSDERNVKISDTVNCGRRLAMTKNFKIGDHVSWNSEAGRVRGTITRKITAPTRRKGYVRHASKGEPQYFIKSDKTDHIAIHKGSALRKLKK